MWSENTWVTRCEDLWGAAHATAFIRLRIQRRHVRWWRRCGKSRSLFRWMADHCDFVSRIISLHFRNSLSHFFTVSFFLEIKFSQTLLHIVLSISANHILIIIMFDIFFIGETRKVCVLNRWSKMCDTNTQIYFPIHLFLSEKTKWFCAAPTSAGAWLESTTRSCTHSPDWIFEH